MFIKKTFNQKGNQRKGECVINSYHEDQTIHSHNYIYILASYCLFVIIDTRNMYTLS